MRDGNILSARKPNRLLREIERPFFHRSFILFISFCQRNYLFGKLVSLVSKLALSWVVGDLT